MKGYKKKLAIILIIFVIGSSLLSFADTKISEENVEYLKGLINLIESKYVGDVSEEELMEGAYRGMFEVLDKHSTYFSKEEYQDFNESVEGEFTGIGATVTKDGDYVGVVAPIENTPAYNAGIKTNDVIVEIDGEDINGWSLEKAVSKIRGEDGTKVKLGIVRQGASDILYFEITRGLINVKYLDYEILDDNIGYVDIERFVKGTADNLSKAIKDFESKNAKGMILDLRGNPGGELPEAIEVADMLVSKGKSIVFIDYKDENDLEYFAKKERTRLPLVILVDEGSASASEIVTGAVKDNEEGVIIGQKTYGKGSVQTVWSLTNGGGVKITIAEYFSPNRNKIDGEGIEPDFVILNPDSMDENADIDFAPIIEGGTFKLGDKGLDIYGIQQRLKYLGYPVAADGVFGESTKKNIISFQKASGMEEDGIIDLELRQKVLEKTLDRFVVGSEDLQLQRAIDEFKK